jgi:DNA (cytosine-5)-methyltransferase 1
VFVVASARNDICPAEILFEFEGVRRDTSPSRKEGQETPAFTASSFGGYSEGVGTLRTAGGDLGGGSETLCLEKVGTLLARDYKGLGSFDHDKIIVQQAFRKGRSAQSVDDYETWVDDGKANTLNTFDLGDVRTTHAIALAENTIGRQPQNGGNGNGFTENGPMYTLNATGVHGVSYGFEPGIAKREGEPNRFVEKQTPTLRANMKDNQTAVVHAFKVRGGCEGGGKGYLGQDEKAFTISTTQDQQIHHNMAVRRLTPIECERLQGFPDNYTNIKTNCPDGPRYKALGNSWAVPVVAWIGKRINDAIA